MGERDAIQEALSELARMRIAAVYGDKIAALVCERIDQASREVIDRYRNTYPVVQWRL